MEDATKPGWKTTEFWLTLTHLLMAMLGATGVVALTDAASLEGKLADVVTAVFALAASAHVIANYVRARTTAKTMTATASGSTTTTIVVEPGQENSPT